MNLYEVPDIDLDIPKDQQLIRAMAWSVVEEAGEAMEVFEKIQHLPFLNDRADEINDHLGDEVADMTHFYLELLMMSKIGVNDFLRFAPINSWTKFQGDNWESTYFKDFVVQLALAVNCLKNRFWRKTSLKTEVLTYENRLLVTIPKFFKFIQSLGFDEKTWIDYYLRKNEVNLFRIRSRY